VRWCLLAALVACSGGEPRRPTPPVAQVPLADAAPPDLPDASQDEQLAAIGHAMTQLDGAARQCWAVAATERFDIEGELAAQIEISANAKQAQVSIVRDSTRSPKLAACVTNVLTVYPWAPPLHGQTIQLPFKFRAPDGQNVIDRQLVSFGVQAKVAVAVLLDEANTGNAAASMFELKIAAGGTTGMRWANRAELWYFFDAGEVRSLSGAPQAFAAGDMMYVPAGGARELVAKGSDVRAMLVVKPGSREGSARGGALPTREASRGAGTPVGPVLLPASKATSYPRGTGKVAIYAEPSTISSKDMSASVIELPAGANIPEHTHPKETELLYVMAGSGTMIIDGVTLPVTPTSVVQIPPATKHAFTATADLRAVQVYTPAGPEQRFKGTK
jgi:quercetin dioxygenase-like cupin family protein